MRSRYIAFFTSALIVIAGPAAAQGRGGGAEWHTAGGDAQRSSWIRNDAAMSVEALTKGGFDVQWKTKLDERGRQNQALGQGIVINGIAIFLPLSVVTGVSNNVYAIDNDTGYVSWQKHFTAPLAGAGTASCPGGVNGAAARMVALTPAPPAPPRAGGPGGRGGYQSMVGEPGEGAPVLQRGGGAGRGGAPAAAPGAVVGREGAPAAGAPAPPAGAPPAGQAGAAPAAAPGGGGGAGGRGNAGGEPAVPGMPPGVPAGGGAGFGRAAGVTYVITSDGVMYTLSLLTGKEIQQAAPFVPANARTSDPIAVANILYVTTTGKCGGVADGVWAMDLAAAGKPVVSWKTNGGSPIGNIAFTPGGAVIATIGAGQTSAGGYANAVVALDPKTLEVKDWFTAPGTELASAPMIFKHGEKDIVAVAAKDGRILMLDAASLGGANHSTPLSASQPVAGVTPANAPEALATWYELNGAKWLLLPAAGKVTAMKIADEAGRPVLQPGWVSRDLASPATPITVNGVVFAMASGRTGTPAVLYAFDGATGKELWNSGRAMTSHMTGRSFWSGTGQVYVGTGDGTVYAFGFPMERK